MPPKPQTYRTPSLTGPQTIPDPTAPGTLIRRAFLLEAFLNTLTLPLLIAPLPILSHLLTDPSILSTSPLLTRSSSAPTIALLARLFAGLVIGALTPPLLYCGLRDSRAAIEGRKLVYLMLGGGEAVLVPLFVWEAIRAGRGEVTAFTGLASWGCVGGMLPPLLWRCWCFWDGKVWGRYREGVKEE